MKWLSIISSLLLIMSCSSDRGTANLISGTYELLEWKATKSDGSIVHPYGQQARGQLIYLEDGTMSMHLEGDSRPMLGTDDYDLLDSLTILQAYKTYFSYYGSYAIDKEQKVVTHRIDGCKNPDWKGKELKRRFAFDGEQLIIRSDSVIGMDHILIWTRLKTASHAF